MNHLKEKSMRMVFMISACASILSVAMICIFLFANGIPAIGKIGIFDFLLGEKWKPGNDIYGILPMILGSIYVTAGAIVVGVPIGILTAIFMSRFCPRSLYRIMKPAIDLLAGIPSVVYGFFGMVVIVPVMSKLFGGSGKSMATASVFLRLSGYQNQQLMRFLPAIMKEPWLWEPAMKEVYFLLHFQLQNQEFLQV